MRGAHFVGTQIPLSCHLIEVRQVLPPSLIDVQETARKHVKRAKTRAASVGDERQNN
jgi:hypothetical protein